MKKRISVSNLTSELYIDYVRPAAIAAGIIDLTVTEDGKQIYVTDTATADEIAHCMYCACMCAGNDGIERTNEEYVRHEAERMIGQLEVSIKYDLHNTVSTLTALMDAMTAATAPRREIIVTLTGPDGTPYRTRYGANLLDSLRAEARVMEIADADTGEILYTRDDAAYDIRTVSDYEARQIADALMTGGWTAEDEAQYRAEAAQDESVTLTPADIAAVFAEIRDMAPAQA